MKKKVINRKIIIIFIYLAVSFFFICFHEEWKDEAQSWLLVKNLNFLELLDQMKYEGHPYLWYLILMPFAKLGFPYFTQKIISWIFVGIGGVIILTKSPFNLFTKVLILFSWPMIYLYPAVSRSYCLIPLFMSLVAIFYKDRNEKPFRYLISLCLLANIHIVMLGFVGMLFLTFYIEKIKERKNNSKKYNIKIFISFILVSIILLLSYFPILNCLNENSEANKIISINMNNGLLVFVKFFYNIIIYYYYLFSSFGFALCFMLLVFTVVLFIYEYKLNKRNFFIILFSIFYQLIIYSIVWYNSYQRANSIVFMLMFIAWIQIDENKDQILRVKLWPVVNIIIGVFLMLSVFTGIFYGIYDCMEDYSSAYKVADYIKENVSSDSTIVSLDVGGVTAILPYVDNYNFWSICQEKYFNYSTWNQTLNKDIKNIDIFKSRIIKNFEENSDLYLINSKSTEKYQIDYNKILEELEKNNLITKVYSTNSAKIMVDENYNFYKIEREFFLKSLTNE